MVTGTGIRWKRQMFGAAGYRVDAACHVGSPYSLLHVAEHAAKRVCRASMSLSTIESLVSTGGSARF